MKVDRENPEKVHPKICVPGYLALLTTFFFYLLLGTSTLWVCFYAHLVHICQGIRDILFKTRVLFQHPGGGKADTNFWSHSTASLQANLPSAASCTGVPSIALTTGVTFGESMPHLAPVMA